MSYDLIGLETLVDQEHGAPSTGWTAPTLIWERMREISVAAAALDQQIKAKIKRPAFLSHWDDWYKHWRDLVARYDSWTAKLAAATYSDELAAEVEVQRKALQEWHQAYLNEDRANVPLPGLPAEPIPPPPPPGHNGLHLPWWVWVLGGSAIIGGAFFIHKRYIATRQDPRLREMTSRYGLPSTSQIDNARREVTQVSHRYLNAGRDPARDHEDPRYDRGTVLGGVQMCPCPNQGLHEMATFDPES